jgi:predicted AlkP superfamily phosphohydrolase/phosphomutase
MIWWIAAMLFDNSSLVDTGVTYAYIGPGAGFAVLGSFFTMLAGVFLSFASLLLWPFRVLRSFIRRRRGFRRATVRKVIFLGLDGLDHKLTARYLAEGKLPNLARLQQQGSFSALRTTFPALSPVAWSTFATGVSPAKHNIFDFLNRNLRSYRPELSSASVGKPRRVWKVGKLRIPLSLPVLEMRRKSRPFWTILGEHGIGSTVLRVPITFPPEKFNGRMLSAMCTPDLKGTQGSFSQFSTRLTEASFENGSRYPLERAGEHLTGRIEGPEDTFIEGGTPLHVKFRVKVNPPSKAHLEIGGETYELDAGKFSPWIELTFRNAIGMKIRGVARFLLTRWGDHTDLYMSPINIDPAHPALPISHPFRYSAYLANLLGTFATTGMAEDTWALNEGVIDEAAFLAQAYSIFEEREAMFISALENTRFGMVACVFDTSDRIQHMFFRKLGTTSGQEADPIETMYRRMDELVGRTLRYVDPSTALFVLSDHGFCSFARGVNLNTWLRREGYLVLREDATESGQFFNNVDWTRTRAYALGLSGVYLNLRDRESRGIVEPGGEAARLKNELIAKLTSLRDDKNGREPVQAVYDTQKLYRGPYLDAAPDLIVGYAEGYRVAWEAAVGRTSTEVISDNDKPWSGDHSVDPLLVPGVLFSNLAIAAPDPGIEDLAPTALSLFGVPVPQWMEGRTVLHPL